MTVSISPEAHQGWREFTARHGVNMTALAEAFGLNFELLDQDHLPPDLARAVEDARAIGAERFSRQRDPYD